MYTKLASEMIRHASKRAKTIIDVHEAFRRAGSNRIHDLRNAPAVVMAPDGEYRIVKLVKYDAINIDCATASEAQTVLEEALGEMGIGKDKSAELFNADMAEYFTEV